MRGEILGRDALGPGDVAAWRELAARAAEPNPFAEPDLIQPAVAPVHGLWLGQL